MAKLRDKLSKQMAFLESVGKKSALLDQGDAPMSLDDLELFFPQGFQGWPKDSVIAALNYCDARGITNADIRRINVAQWCLASLAYAGQAEGELYRRVKTAYHVWVHLARPWEACGYCEPLEEGSHA